MIVIVMMMVMMMIVMMMIVKMIKVIVMMIVMMVRNGLEGFGKKYVSGLIMHLYHHITSHHIYSLCLNQLLFIHSLTIASTSVQR